MIHTDENEFIFYASTDEMKEYCLQPIKAVSVCQFFTLQGRVTKIIKENLIPIEGLSYAVLAKHPEGDRYYTREFRMYSIDELYFYKREDTAIENLRRYVEDSRVILMLKPEMVADTTEMLKRLYKSYFKSEGQLPYKIWVRLMEACLDAEDYQNDHKSLPVYKTVLNQYSIKIEELWKQAKK